MKTEVLLVNYNQKKDVLRNIVVKYIDYFYPNAAGNSAVAIDNKIEQAMDLVKSHLMFAVREEVEVLKEKIAELMDRINQLETENSILKANASQEVLAQLSSPNQTQAVSGSAVIAILPVQVQMPQQGQGLQALPMSQQQGQQGQGQQGQGQQGQGQQAQVPSAQQNISPANGSNGNANNS